MPEPKELMVLTEVASYYRDRLAGLVYPGGPKRGEFVAALDRQAAEITRLQAIVDKLPKTADGVPVTPGMTVWLAAQGEVSMFTATGGGSEHTIFAWPMTFGVAQDCGFENMDGLYPPKTFSTRTAAEAARSKNKRKENK